MKKALSPPVEPKQGNCESNTGLLIWSQPSFH